ncbi:unnamed protein product [Brachionus calyciflorus]|uniref:Uncharacterized protein n=1 Tax=Brachionus calyciflorus TaxID=104777 RepID=A0A813TVI4_9BILA|nr:unnamed protein product [Brachionus calyciflorus]
MTNNFCMLLILCSLTYLVGLDNLEDNDDKLSYYENQRYIFTIEIIPKTAIEMIKLLRSLTPFQIIQLARLVNEGYLNPRILTSVGIMKSLGSKELQIVQTRVNVSHLSKRVMEHLNYLIYLSDDERSKIANLKNTNYFKAYEKSQFNRVKKQAIQNDIILDKNLIKLLYLFYFIESHEIEIIIILRDMEILPNNILKDIIVINSMKTIEFIQLIKNLDRFPTKLDKSLSFVKFYKVHHLHIMFSFLNMSPSELNLLYSLAFLKMIPPEHINILTFNLKMSPRLKNILDLSQELKTFSNETIEIIKSMSNSGIISIFMLNALEFLDLTSLKEINNLIQTYRLDKLLKNDLSPILSHKILNLVNALKNFDNEKIIKLYQISKEGKYPSKILEAANLISSLADIQIRLITQQKNLKQLPISMINIFEYLGTIGKNEYDFIMNQAFPSKH